MTANLKGVKVGWIWLVIRLYLGYQWVEASWHKITGAAPFDASGFIKGAIANSVPKTPGAKPVVQAWWASFLQHVALPNATLFNFMVQYGEMLVGLALILGFATLFAASMGMLMNFAFLLSGTVSSNANLLFLEVILLTLGGAYAGYLGVDYWFRPWFRGHLSRLLHFGDGKTAHVA
jgi:thiosulfate dehydrogenase [quinone] large subunit